MRLFAARLLACVATLTLAAIAVAHGGTAGDVTITHPFATPTPTGAVNGSAYFVSLENKGSKAEKLQRASTAVADHVELGCCRFDGHRPKLLEPSRTLSG